MPRLRFQWVNLSHGFLQDLAVSLGLGGDPSESLRSKYGQKPKETFIQDAWPSLLKYWLENDPKSRRSLVKALKSRNLGDVSISDENKYLASCRNTVNLRQEVLQLFLAVGEQSSSQAETSQAAILSASQASPQAISAETAEKPNGLDKDSMTSFAVRAISKWYEISEDQIHIDNDGDIYVPNGSAVVFVSAVEGCAFRLFSVLLSGVDSTDELLNDLNVINSNLMLGTLYVDNKTVFLSHNLVAECTTDHAIGMSVHILGNIGDSLDHKLQERHGGRIFLREPASDEIEV